MPDAERVRTPHQYVDQRALFASLTLWSATFGRHSGAGVAAAAVSVAAGARPGPVHLDFDPSYEGVEVAPAAPRPTETTLPDALVACLGRQPDL